VSAETIILPLHRAALGVTEKLKPTTVHWCATYNDLWSHGLPTKNTKQHKEHDYTYHIYLHISL